MNLLVCLLVIAITGTLVIKKFKAQTVLLLGGLIMMFAAYLLGYTTSFVEAKKSTGVLFFDAFEFINITTAKVGKPWSHDHDLYWFCEIHGPHRC